jgi:hypothetical protein
MRAINHALTGVIAVAALPHPALGLPAAFLSHFALDALPHHGFSDLHERGRKFNIVLALDAVACAALVLVLYIAAYDDWLVLSAGAFLAACPDFMWLPGYLRQIRGQAERGAGDVLMRFHGWIQWYQRPPGALIEIIWFMAAVLLVLNLRG